MKTIFWNVDTQYDFMRVQDEDGFKGALGLPGAKDIEVNLEALTKYAERKNIKVVNTADWHNKETREISENPDYKTTFPRHCMMGSKGSVFVPATAPSSSYILDWRYADFSPNIVRDMRNITLYKDAFDVFAGSPHTEKVLEIIKPDKAVVYGVATNVCVDFAVIGLRKRGIDVYVPTDAIKEIPGLPLEEVLQNWERNGVKLIKTEDVLEGKI